MIICQGCGQAFEPPAGYGRSKIQCPGCGVICPVPPGAAAAAPPPPADEEEPIRLEVVADAVPTVAAEHTGNRPRVERKPQETFVNCRRCGRPIRRQRECPVCDAAGEADPVPEEPRPQAAPRVGLAAHSLELDDPLPLLQAVDEEEDPSPYVLAERLLPRCPKCSKDMPEQSVLCVHCGFDLRTRRRVRRDYEPMALQWETNASFERRLMWFAVGQGVHVLLGLLSAAFGPGGWPFVVSWPLLAGTLAFILGTYERIGLTRDTRGRVKLTSTWRFCFVPLAPVVTEVRGFEGVTTGQWHDAGFLEWFVFVSLLCLGVVPAIIWYVNAIHTPQFHVALARDHGRSEVYVYRGRQEAQMHAIADALCRAAELRNIT